MTLTSAFARRFSNVALRSSNAAPVLARTRRITVLAALTTLAVAFGVLTATPAVAAAPATANNIELNVVVAIPADWGTKANNWTTERILKTLNASDEYWSTMTGGKTGFDVPATIKTVTTAAKSTDPGKTILDTVVAEQGFDKTAQWKGLVVFVPQAKVASGTGSPAAAMSYNNNLQSGGYMIVADERSAQNTLTNLVAHEFGHFFMIPHANRLGCSDGSTDSLPGSSATGWANTSCATVEYDDNNDVMSNAYSLGSLNTYLTESAGFATTGSIQTVTPTTKTSTYSLQPWGNTTANGVRSIKVIDPANGTPYYVELRQAVGIDKNDATGVRAGVKIVKKNSGPQGGSVVIDPTPTTLSGNTDGKQTWEAGSSFTTASNSTRIDIESINANSAKVSVTDIRAGRGGAAGVASPIVTATSNSGAAWYTGNSYIDVTAKDSAGAAIPGTVSVYRGGVYLADVTIGTSATTRYTLPLNTEAGTYSFTLIHSNTAVRSGQITHTIVKSSTTTNVVKAPATLAPGETGAIDVRVTIPSGVPLIGSVAASIDGAAAETVALPDAKGGLGTLSLGKLSNGLHHVEFQYAGERNSLPSVGKATVSVTNGTITVVSTGPSTYKGSQGKLTVSAKSTAGKPVTGSVTASENGTQIGKATLSAQGTGTIYLSKSLAVGRHSIVVHHSDSSIADATVIHTVARATAKVTGSASKATIPANNSTATIAVTTSAASGAYGSVQVLRNGGLVATRTVSAANKGAFVYAIGELDAGSYTYTLKYLGSQTVAPASSTVKVAVQHSGSVTAKSTGAVEWSSGKPVITAQAKTTTGVSVAGVIRVYDGTTLLGTATAKTGVNGGTVSIALTKSLGVGSHTLRVVHESKNVEETTVKQVITKTTTTLGVSQKAIAATTKSASNTRFTVTARTKSGAVSAGTILVREKGTVVATLYPKAANNGTVTFTPPKPTAGNHTYSFSFGATSTSNAATKNAAATFTAAKSVTSVSGSVVQSGGKTYITVKLVNKAGKALDGEVTVTKNKAAAPKLVLNSSKKRIGTIAVGTTKGTFTYVIKYAGTASTAGASKTVVVKVS